MKPRVLKHSYVSWYSNVTPVRGNRVVLIWNNVQEAMFEECTDKLNKERDLCEVLLNDNKLKIKN